MSKSPQATCVLIIPTFLETLRNRHCWGSFCGPNSLFISLAVPQGGSNGMVRQLRLMKLPYLFMGLP